MISINNRLVVEPYLSDRAIQTTGGSGFQMIKQKVAVKGLRLLMDAIISEGQKTETVPKGSLIYIREELLHTQPWAKILLESDAVEGKFMLVDKQYVEFIKPFEE